jgi:hypothetical protein
MRDDPMARDRCDLCGRVARLSTCDCCGLVYCATCAAEPDEAGMDCPDEDCNLHP